MGKIKRAGGRPRSRENFPPSITRIAIRQHHILEWALPIFGPYRCAEEAIRRHKEECKQTGRRYERDYAIDRAAKLVGLPKQKLRNWLLRSKRIRDRDA
jgi:hypothetical protein